MAEDECSPGHLSFYFASISRTIGLDFINRVRRVISHFSPFLIYGLSASPVVSAQANDHPVSRNSTEVNNDVLPMQSLIFHFDVWRRNATAIRNGVNRVQCLRNLSFVLGNVGPLRAAENAGSNKLHSHEYGDPSKTKQVLLGHSPFCQPLGP